MEDFDFAHLSNVCNDESMVVQFVNEKGKPIGVGFQAWVPVKALTNGIQALVDTLNVVWWPKQVDGKVPDARKMKKQLEASFKSKDKWELTPVKILAYGGESFVPAIRARFPITNGFIQRMFNFIMLIILCVFRPHSNE